MENSQFYTGLVAEAYEFLADKAPVEFYARLIRQFGEPALELACGAGHPLLSLVKQGLQVEGLDSSADMLARCETTARNLGLTVKLYRAEMQAFSLPGLYRTIYLAGGSFMLMPEVEDASKALGCVHRHLESGGHAIIPLFIPAETLEKDRLVAREYTRATDGVVFRVIVKGWRDYDQVRVTTLRYELLREGTVDESVEREWLLRWYTQEQFRELLLAAGFVNLALIREDQTPSKPGDRAFTFVASRP